MAFETTLMCKTSTNATEGKVFINFNYGPSADTLAVITASGYFDEWVNQVGQNDFIQISGSDGNGIFAFTNATGVTPVTIAEVITAADIPDASIAQVKLVPNSYDGTIAGNVADANVIGGIPQLFRINTPGGVTANTDVIVTHKIRVIDVWVVNLAAGTASDTIEVLNGAAAITDVMNASGADTIVTRAANINDANHEIAASGTLRVTETDGGGSDSPAMAVYVSAIRVA